jgi:hypothetical protein
MVLDRRLHGLDFIEAQSRTQRPCHSPRPEQLLGPAALRHYLREAPGAADRIRTQLSIESHAARSAFFRWHSLLKGSAGEAWHAALLDASSQLSPLFRHSLAERVARDDRLGPVVMAWFEEIAGDTLAEALLQYIPYQAAYNRLWAAVLPPGFGPAAVGRYDHLFGRGGCAPSGTTPRVAAG